MIEVEAGITLNSLNQYIKKNQPELFFPINPTEELATLGAVVAMNARPLNAMKYGFIKDYIEELTFINLDGSKEVLQKDCKKIQTIISSEGKLGAISKVKLKLLQKSSNIWGISFFFEKEEHAFSFIEDLKTIKEELSAVEFIDKKCMDLILKNKQLSEKIKKIPDIDFSYEALVYFEIEKCKEEEIETVVEKIIEIGNNNHANEENSWIFEGYSEVQRMRDLRHAILELILYNKFVFSFNLKIFGKKFGELIRIIKEKLSFSDCFFFGHAENDSVFCVFIEENEVNMKNSLSKLEKFFDCYFLSKDENRNTFFSEYGIGIKNKYFHEKYLIEAKK